MRQLLFAGLVALITSPFVGCCATSSSCLTAGASSGYGAPVATGCGSPGCVDPGCGAPALGYAPSAGLGSSSCLAPSTTAALGPVGLPSLPALPTASAQPCDANCNASLQQGYMHGFSFGSAVSCGIKQALAIPLAAATFVGGTAEALLGGIGSLGTMQYAQTATTISNQGCAAYADSSCTCDDCIGVSQSAEFQAPLQVIPTYPAQTVPAVQGCAPCAANGVLPTPANTYSPMQMPIQQMPLQQMPLQQMPIQNYQPIPSEVPLIPNNGGLLPLPMAPPALPAGAAVPIPRDARMNQSTTYLPRGGGSVMATSF